jgi:membrane-bound serine protease (ClpP class)
MRQRDRWNRFILRSGALSLVLLCAGLLLYPASATAQSTASQGVATPRSTRVLEMRVGDMIHPIMAEYIRGGLDEAVRTNADLVLITMDTPGGFDGSMRDIIQGIITSKIPVVVYVSPAGSRAASAGFFILLAADVAAMAPGTNTGAASPVFLGGGSSSDENEKTMRRKATSDAAAYMRSIVGNRGRNVRLAEQAVTEAKAFSEKEALQGKLIDVVAGSTDELLAALDGRTIARFDGSKVTLEVKNPVRTPIEMNRRQRALSRLAQPDVLFILFLLGILGLYVEFSNPGLILPGVVGAVCLILALVAMQILPINIVGVLLLLLALGFFIMEAKLTSHGLLAVAGVLAMVFGALFLIRSPITGAGVSLGTALGVTIPFALLAVFLMRMVLKSFRWKQAAGSEKMVGEIGEVTQAIDGRGMVFVAGELWRAASTVQIPKGARVRVLKVDGLTVHVEPADKPPQPSA